MAQSFEIGPFHFQTRPLCRVFSLEELKPRTYPLIPDSCFYTHQTRPLRRVFSFQENAYGNTGNRVYSRGSTCDHCE